MLSLDEMLRRYSIRYHKRMLVVTRPLLDRLGIRYFHFHEVKKNGRFFFISNRLELDEFLYARPENLKNNPYVVCPTIIKEGVFDFDHQSFPGSNVASAIMKQEMYIEKLISIVRKTDDGYIVGSFGFPPANPYLLYFIKNNDFLQEYLSYFVSEMNSIINESQLGAVDLQSIMGDNFNNPHYLLVDLNGKENQHFRSILQKKTNGQLFPEFTEREKEVLKLCLEGLSAAEIGRKLHLSKRTDEHRIDKIKFKFIYSKIHYNYGNSYCQFSEFENNLKKVSPPIFTVREKEVLKLCLEGLTAAEIGNKLHLSKRTAEHCTDAIKNKLRCIKKSELVECVCKLFIKIFLDN